MSLYLDTSALLKLYVDEADSDACEAFLGQDLDWASAAHTLVEVRRNLPRLLEADALADATEQFAADWAQIEVIELDMQLCLAAAVVAEDTGARSLDALHIAAALTSGPRTMVTYDVRLVRAAEFVGLETATPAADRGAR